MGELQAAIAVDAPDISAALLLSLCSNFVAVDKNSDVRLAHISVKEYLEEKDFKDV